MRRISTRILPLLLALLIPLGAATAQVSDPEATGGGRDVNELVAPGLEIQTPAEGEIAPADVPIYMPHEDRLVGRVSIPDDKLGTLVQPQGRDWRAFRMDTLMWGTAIVILGMAAALLAFYLWRGTIKLEKPRTGRLVLRFNGIERMAHWTAAISFIVLALTGLVITFGRYLLIPLIGHDLFTPLASGAKYLHNFSSVPFVIGILAMLVLWIRDNIPNRADLEWIRQAGGIFQKSGSHHPEAGRFNAGQKGVFWSVVGGGMIMAVSGYMLLAPFSLTGIGGIQIAHVVHAVLAALMTAMILGHIYIGTVGMEGAFDAMGRGEVDEQWAIEHHRGWYEAQKRGEPVAQPSPGREPEPRASG